MFRSQTEIFHKLVDDYISGPPLLVSEETTCAAAVAAMAENRSTAVIATAANGRISGILTEQDVVRKLLYLDDGATALADVMTRPVMTIAKGDYLYHAIARMRRYRRRHMPVVDATGRPVGMIHLSDALAATNERTMQQIDYLTQEGTIDGLREVKAAQVDLAEALFADNLPAPDIQAAITHLNNDINRRVVDMSVEAMEAEGKGKPPVPFAMLMMGSGGRGENFLYPDQDNGFILDDYPDAEHTQIDSWFIDLAERVTRDLNDVGFPYCKGHVMATNPIWRKTISQWRDQTTMWVRKRSPFAIRFADIFFDFGWVYGERDLVAELRTHVTGITRKAHPFLQQLYEDDAEYGVALGWFGRFKTDTEHPEYKGEINMKHSGTMPLVQGVRLLALRDGIPETSTLARIGCLQAGSALSSDEADYLVGAFRHITNLLLRRQIADQKAGKRVGNYVDPRNLTERERDMLVDSFKAVQEFHNRLRADFTADVF